MSGRRRPRPVEIDLGHGHFMRWLRWAPDDLPANRERYGVPLPRLERAGLALRHPKPDGSGECEASIMFNLPELRLESGHGWTVESWDPLTLSPSLLCTACGDHGYVRGGRWVPV